MISRIGFVLFCGVAAYVVWLLAGNIYIRDIILVEPTSLAMARGKLVAACIGGIGMLVPLFAARGFHKRHNNEIATEVRRVGFIAYIPIIAAALVFAWGIGMIPEVVSAPVQQYIAGVWR